MKTQNKTRFFYVLYSDKTWVFDQSECVQGPIYIMMGNKLLHCIGKLAQQEIFLLSSSANNFCVPEV